MLQCFSRACASLKIIRLSLEVATHFQALDTTFSILWCRRHQATLTLHDFLRGSPRRCLFCRPTNCLYRLICFHDAISVIFALQLNLLVLIWLLRDFAIEGVLVEQILHLSLLLSMFIWLFLYARANLKSVVDAADSLIERKSIR